MIVLRMVLKLDYSYSATYCCKCRILAGEIDYDMQIGHKADNIMEKNVVFVVVVVNTSDNFKGVLEHPNSPSMAISCSATVFYCSDINCQFLLLSNLVLVILLHPYPRIWPLSRDSVYLSRDFNICLANYMHHSGVGR